MKENGKGVLECLLLRCIVHNCYKLQLVANLTAFWKFDAQICDTVLEIHIACKIQIFGRLSPCVVYDKKCECSWINAPAKIIVRGVSLKGNATAHVYVRFAGILGSMVFAFELKIGGISLALVWLLFRTSLGLLERI